MGDHNSSVKTVYPIKKLHQCKICARVFIYPIGLQKHMLIHRSDSSPNEKTTTHCGSENKKRSNFECDLCSASFFNGAELKYHRNQHLGTVPNECTICHKSFASASTLNVHFKKHLGTLPYKCPLCEYSFACAYTLENHKQRHLGIKEQKCTFCEQAFVTPNELKSHTRRHHTYPLNGSNKFVEFPRLLPDIAVKTEPEEDFVNDDLTLPTLIPKPSESHSGNVAQAGFLNDHASLHTWNNGTSDIVVKMEPPDDFSENCYMNAMNIDTSQSYSDIVVKSEPPENICSDISQNYCDILVKQEPQEINTIANVSMYNLNLEESQSCSEIIVKEEPPESICSEISEHDSDIIFLDNDENQSIEICSIGTSNNEASQSYSDIIIKEESQESISTDISQTNPHTVVKLETQENDCMENSSMHLEASQSYSDVIVKQEPPESVSSDIFESNSDIAFKLEPLDNSQNNSDIFVKVEPQESNSSDYSPLDTLETGPSHSAANVVVKMEEGLFDEEINSAGATKLPFKVDVAAAVNSFLTLQPDPTRLSFFGAQGTGIERQIMIANVGKLKLKRIESLKSFPQNDNHSVQMAGEKLQVDNIYIKNEPSSFTEEPQINGEGFGCVPTDRRRVGYETYKCNCCEKTFTARFSLQTHINRMHMNVDNEHKCSFCGVVLTTPYNLKIHIERYHTNRELKLRKNHKIAKFDALLDTKNECSVCNEIFVNERSLVVHLENCHPQVTSPYKCLQCETTFRSSHALKEHKKRHLSSNTDKCIYCTKTFATSYGLKKHIRTHLDAIVLKCTSCDEVCTSVAELNIHMKQHVSSAGSADKPSNLGDNFEFLSGNEDDGSQTSLTDTDPEVALQIAAQNGRFKCNCCNAQCESSSDLISHLKKHLTDARNKGIVNFETATELVGKESVRHKCPLCKESFLFDNELKMHLKSHRDHRPYECNFCEKSFRSPSCIRSHLRTHTKILDCGFCGKRFSSNSALNEHMHTHRELRPHKCTFCEKSYTTVNALLTHLHRKHLDADSFKCPTCQKTFSRAPELNRHLRRHLGIKPFKCAGCLKTFAELQDLRDHINRKYKRGVGKMYACDYCAECFYDDTDLRLHLKEHKRTQIYTCSRCGAVFKTVDDVTKHKNSHTPQPEPLRIKKLVHKTPNKPYEDEIDELNQAHEHGQEEIRYDYALGDNIDVEDFVTRLTKIKKPPSPLFVHHSVIHPAADTKNQREVISLMPISISNSATESQLSNVDHVSTTRTKVKVNISALLNAKTPKQPFNSGIQQLVTSKTFRCSSGMVQTVAQTRSVSISAGGRSEVQQEVGKMVNGMDVDNAADIVPMAQFSKEPFQNIFYKTTGATVLGESLKENNPQIDGVSKVNKLYNGFMTRDETTPLNGTDDKMEEEYLSDIEFLSDKES